MREPVRAAFLAHFQLYQEIPKLQSISSFVAARRKVLITLVLQGKYKGVVKEVRDIRGERKHTEMRMREQMERRETTLQPVYTTAIKHHKEGLICAAAVFMDIARAKTNQTPPKYSQRDGSA